MLRNQYRKIGEVEMKEYYDWDEGCYEKVTHSDGAKKNRHSEEIKDELVSLMIKFLEDHEIFRLLELVASAVATKEQKDR